jgi:hypothetical protein
MISGSRRAPSHPRRSSSKRPSSSHPPTRRPRVNGDARQPGRIVPTGPVRPTPNTGSSPVRDSLSKGPRQDRAIPLRLSARLAARSVTTIHRSREHLLHKGGTFRWRVHTRVEPSGGLQVATQGWNLQVHRWRWQVARLQVSTQGWNLQVGEVQHKGGTFRWVGGRSKGTEASDGVAPVSWTVEIAAKQPNVRIPLG